MTGERDDQLFQNRAADPTNWIEARNLKQREFELRKLAKDVFRSDERYKINIGR